MRASLLLGAAMAVLIPAGQAAQSAQAFDVLAIAPLCQTETGPGAGSAVVKTPPMSAAFGNGVFKIDGSADGQRWFNYGLQLAWAFSHEDAKGAFAEAVKRDPDCGMCAWGHAWSLGPTINYGLEPAQKVEALAAAMKAQKMLAGASERDRLLADALVLRYGKDGDKAFAKALRPIVERFPDDPVILVFSADAEMVANNPAAAIPLLERVLARNPDDAGAIHFYIHATEWVGDPGKAERYADRLGAVAPGASHLIHMPSHTYYQIGRYRDAARVNLEAIVADDAWIKTKGGAEDDFTWGYYGHNTSFALGGAMMAGDAEAALKMAKVFESMGARAKEPWQQVSMSRAWYAYGRFADPAKVLAMPAPAHPAQAVLWRYGRGEAQARRGNAAGVAAEAAAIEVLRKSYGPKEADAAVFADVSSLVLRGRQAMLSGDPKAAATYYKRAMALQERTMGDYRDPPPWWYPIRRSYAAALLAAGKPKMALAEAQKTLVRWPHDPLTLVVLSRSQEKLGMAAESQASLKAAGREWVGGSLTAFALPLV